MSGLTKTMSTRLSWLFGHTKGFFRRESVQSKPEPSCLKVYLLNGSGQDLSTPSFAWFPNEQLLMLSVKREMWQNGFLIVAMKNSP